jgi:hypothetical protein
MASTLKLTGTKAIAALVVVAAVVIFQFFLRQQSLQTQAVDQVKLHLASEYTRLHLPKLQKAVSTGSLTDTRAGEIVEQVTPDNIEIVSISARGRKDRYVARVEVTVAGSGPPDGRPVRYFRMEHSTLTGWRITGDSTVWGYRLAF